MMSAETVLDRIEINTGDGSVSVRLQKRVRNGDAVLSSEPHRTLFTPESDVDGTIALVNAHLEAMGFPAVSAPDILKIKAYAELAAPPAE
jgi:hypothetical protein